MYNIPKEMYNKINESLKDNPLPSKKEHAKVLIDYLLSKEETDDNGNSEKDS